jgi:hypothetical protein
MKTALLALASAAVFAVPSAFGQGAAGIIKQRAKEAAGRPPAAAPAPAAQPGTATAVAPAGGAAQVSVTKVVTDIAIIKSRPTASQEQKDKLAANLAAVATGANKPSGEAVAGLASAVADAIAGKKISSADQTSLANSLAGALNAAAGSPQFRGALQGVQDALVLAGVNDAGVQAVTKALTGLATKAK